MWRLAFVVRSLRRGAGLLEIGNAVGVKGRRGWALLLLEGMAGAEAPLFWS